MAKEKSSAPLAEGDREKLAILIKEHGAGKIRILSELSATALSNASAGRKVHAKTRRAIESVIERCKFVFGLVLIPSVGEKSTCKGHGLEADLLASGRQDWGWLGLGQRQGVLFEAGVPAVCRSQHLRDRCKKGASIPSEQAKGALGGGVCRPGPLGDLQGAGELADSVGFSA